MSHFIVKLISGEFVYGTIENVKEKGMVVIKNPLTWQDYDDGEGCSGSALVKYIIGSTDSEIPISTTAIASMASMSPAFQEFYEVAVVVQQITDEAYNENLGNMTTRMLDLIMDYQARTHALNTGELVATHKAISKTIH